MARLPCKSGSALRSEFDLIRDEGTCTRAEDAVDALGVVWQVQLLADIWRYLPDEPVSAWSFC